MGRSETSLSRALADAVSFSETPRGLARELQQVVPQGEPAPAPAHTLPLLLQSLRAVGLARLVPRSDDLSTFEIGFADLAGRSHALEVRVPGAYPEDGLLVRDQLPVPAGGKPAGWVQWAGLEEAVAAWEAGVASHQGFWDEMDLVDAATWVLEPENPTRDSAFRRIAIGNHCSVHIEVDPEKPRAIPVLRLFGSEVALVDISRRCASLSSTWDPTRSILDNLVALVGSPLPSRADAAGREDLSADCGICFCYRLKDKAPDRACEEPRCAKPFHSQCLLEWLRAIPGARQSFNVIFGACPFCSTPLTATIT